MELLTQELLTKWTGLEGLDLAIFYLEYKKQSSNTLPPNNLHQIKEDILEFKKQFKNSNKQSSIFPPIKKLINFWESRLLNSVNRK